MDHFSRYDGLEILVEWIAPFKEGKEVADIQLAIVLTKVSPLRDSQSICAPFFYNDNDNRDRSLVMERGEGRKERGVKAMSDSLEDGAKLFFIKKFMGISRLIARYILRGFHLPSYIAGYKQYM